MSDRHYTNCRYLDTLQERIVVFDGAMGTNLQAMNLKPEDFGDERYTGCIDHFVLSKSLRMESNSA